MEVDVATEKEEEPTVEVDLSTEKVVEEKA